VTIDQLDWNEIYRTHAQHLRRVITRRAGTAQVDDVLQETFARAYRSRHRLDLGRPIKPWLTAIAVRASLDACTHQHEPMSPVPQPTASPAADEEVFARQRGAVIAAAFGVISDRHRRLLASVAYEEATPRALAAQEGIAPEAMRAVLSRARQSFRLAYQRFAEQAGLATLGGSLRPAFTRARLRTLPIERIRPLEAFAVLLFATTATTSASSGTPVRGGVVEAPPTVGISLASISTGASEMMSSAAVARLSERSDVSVRAPGAHVVGSVDRREGTLNTFWALRLEPLGAELTLGTDGSTGRLGVEVEITQDGQSSELFAGANVEDCSAGSVTVSTACDAYERGEALGRSTE
jgi:RNA polymerase sigma factor (sigma-70 family)